MTSANGRPSITTFTGVEFSLMDPSVEMIDIVDIAHGLSNTCRFAGQSSEFYSVAQHSIAVSMMTVAPPALKMQGLLHDASEAYIHDVSRPLKKLLPAYKVIETRLMRVIAEKFHISWPMHPSVKTADEKALAIEGSRFMKAIGDEYGPPPESEMRAAEPTLFMMSPMKPVIAEQRFLMEYRRLICDRQSAAASS